MDDLSIWLIYALIAVLKLNASEKGSEMEPYHPFKWKIDVHEIRPAPRSQPELGSMKLVIRQTNC